MVENDSKPTSRDGELDIEEEIDISLESNTIDYEEGTNFSLLYTYPKRRIFVYDNDEQSRKILKVLKPFLAPDGSSVLGLRKRKVWDVKQSNIVEKISSSVNLPLLKSTSFLAKNGRAFKKIVRKASLEEDLTTLDDLSTKVSSKLRPLHLSYTKQAIKLLKKRFKSNVELKDTINLLSRCESSAKSRITDETNSLVQDILEDVSSLIEGSSLLFVDSYDSTNSTIVVGNQDIQTFDIPRISRYAGAFTFLILCSNICKFLLPRIKELEVEDQIERITNQLQGYVEAEFDRNNLRNLDDLVSVIIGTTLSFREDIWLTNRLLQRIVYDFKEVWESIVAEEKYEPFKNMYEDSIPQTEVEEAIDKLSKIHEFIEAKTSLLQETGLKVESMTPSDSKQETSFDAEFINDVISLYFGIHSVRLFVELWNELLYFTDNQIDQTDEEDSESSVVNPDVVISARNVFKSYFGKENNVYAIRGVNFDVREGEFVAVVGSSGSGKTTLLNLLSGLDSPDEGKIYVSNAYLDELSDRELTAFRRTSIAFIFQDFALLPEYSAGENVQIPRFLRNKRSGTKTAATELLDSVGLDTQNDRLPLELSGGQQQRVAIARSLVNRPSVIFADEPTGSLDRTTGLSIIEQLLDWNKQGSTIMMVTHDLEMAAKASRVLILADGKLKKDVSSPGDDLNEIYKSAIS